MMEWILIAVGGLILLPSIANIISIIQARKLKNFLSSVGTSVPKDYFDPFSEKALNLIHYEGAAVSGLSSVSSDGIYLESIFKFHVVIPWEAIFSIRVCEHKGKPYAHLRIRHEGEINRELTVPWSAGFERNVPNVVSLIRD